MDYDEQEERTKLREAFSRQPPGESLTEELRDTVQNALKLAVAARVDGFELRVLVFQELSAGIGEQVREENARRLTHDVLVLFVKTFSSLVRGGGSGSVSSSRLTS